MTRKVTKARRERRREICKHRYTLFDFLLHLYDSFHFLFRICVQYMIMWQIFTLFALLPVVAAAEEQPFPDITFNVFSQFIQANFDPTITLSTVMMLLLTMTENVSLLNLHGRQQNAVYPQEKSSTATGWIRALARQVLIKAGERSIMVKGSDMIDDEGRARALGLKLDLLAKLLKLYPCNKKGKFVGKIKPISNRDIQPVLMICPDAVVCETDTCNPRSLVQYTRPRDIPLVKLIKNFCVYEQVPVLCGHCPECNRFYYADHERVKISNTNKSNRIYLNSAKYIKIGRILWVDRVFTTMVLSGFYNFHTSAATYAAFWNSISHNFLPGIGKLSRRQIWQAFVQESIRFIASKDDVDLTLQDGLPIDEITREAFANLGQQGVIYGALEHSCDECTQKYKARADLIGSTDHSATVGVDDVDIDIITEQGSAGNAEGEHAPVKMVVLDGIVMGHTVSLIIRKILVLNLLSVLCI